MKPKPIIHREVSKKEKHQYTILMHIYMEFRKMVMTTLYAKETDTKNRLLDSEGEARVG